MTGEVAVEQCVDSSSQIRASAGYSSECISSVLGNVRKTIGKCTNFHHLTLWVSNAKQYALHFCVHFGFSPLAYSGLETGNRQYVTHVVKQNRIILAFVSPPTGDEKTVNQHIIKHGDGVQDIAFEVDCIETLLGSSLRVALGTSFETGAKAHSPFSFHLEHSKSRGGTIVKDVWSEQDEFGEVKMAILKAFGDTTHTLVERKNYRGPFLPGYKKPMYTVSWPRLSAGEHAGENGPN